MEVAEARADGLFEFALVIRGVHLVDDALGVGVQIRIADERVAVPRAPDALDRGVDPPRALGVVEPGVVPVENGGCVDLQHL